MVKIFCDSCKNEITDGLISEFTLVFKDKKGTLLGKKEELKKGTFMLCENCGLEVRNIILNGHDNSK